MGVKKFPVTRYNDIINCIGYKSRWIKPDISKTNLKAAIIEHNFYTVINFYELHFIILSLINCRYQTDCSQRSSAIRYQWRRNRPQSRWHRYTDWEWYPLRFLERLQRLQLFYLAYSFYLILSLYTDTLIILPPTLRINVSSQLSDTISMIFVCVYGLIQVIT